ncbi:MAG: DUF1287 domain-containing protein [Candidatus Ozemobacteraceae bacterium]
MAITTAAAKSSEYKAGRSRNFFPRDLKSCRALFFLLLGFFFLTGTATAGGWNGTALVEAARRQVGVTRIYDGAYSRIPYPGGDVSVERGVCTDVIVRAYRAFGIDLQKLVHEDMIRAWNAYPRNWGLKRTDTNIDHRRVPNLAVFFRRHGKVFSGAREKEPFQPGDLITWRLPGNLPHVGIVSDQMSSNGIPKIIHNIGAGAVEEDILYLYPITGHFRYEVKK